LLVKIIKTICYTTSGEREREKEGRIIFEIFATAETDVPRCAYGKLVKKKV